MLESRRSAGVVERGGLENRCARERTVGSNPTSSAILRLLNLTIIYAQALSLGISYLKDQ